MDRVAVYNFTVFDVEKGANILSKRKGTLEAIQGAKGTAILETGEVVRQSDLDGNGFLKQVQENE